MKTIILTTISILFIQVYIIGFLFSWCMMYHETVWGFRTRVVHSIFWPMLFVNKWVFYVCAFAVAYFIGRG